MVMVVAMSPASKRRKEQLQKQKQQQQQQQQQGQQQGQNRNNRQSAGSGGGLLGKLLLPNYTDAGASTAFQPQQRTGYHNNNNGDNDNNDTDNSGGDGNLILPAISTEFLGNATGNDALRSPDTFSEAATEIHDNRSRKSSTSAAVNAASKNSKTSNAGRLIAASSLQLSVGSLPPSGAQSSSSYSGRTEGDNNMIVTGVVSPARPSAAAASAAAATAAATSRIPIHKDTTPTRESVSHHSISASQKKMSSSLSSSPPTPSSRPAADDHSSTRYSFFPSTKPPPTPSPVASSMPSVSIIDNSANSNGRNQDTTTTSESAVTSPPRVNRTNNIVQQPTMERSTSNVAVVLDNTDDDNEVVDRRGEKRSMDGGGGVGSASALTEHNLNSVDSNTLSMWQNSDKSAAAMMSNHVALNRNSGDGGDDDICSEVSSTASEMGTVINMGEEARAARMAEIDAMAAEFDDTDAGDVGKNPTGNQTNERIEIHQQHNDSRDEGGTGSAPLSTSLFALEESGLSLPTLESKSFDQPSALPVHRRQRPESGNDAQLLQQQRLRLFESVSFDDTISRGKTTRLDDVNDFENDAVSASTDGNGIKKGESMGNRHLTATEIVSATLRRMGGKGTSLGSRTANKGLNNSLSAPNTPKASYWPDTTHAQDLIKATLTPRRSQGAADDEKEIESRDLPSSFALRSPGSLARFSLQKSSKKQEQGQDQSRPELSPRFSSLNRLRFANDSRTERSKLQLPRRGDGQILDNEMTQPSSTKVSISPGLGGISQTFQIAQKCFSFDTTLDGQYSVAGYNEDDLFVHQPSLRLPTGGYQQRNQLKPRLGPLEEIGSSPSHVSQDNLHSRSWDGGNDSNVFTPNIRQQMPFRNTSSWRRGPSSTRAELGLQLDTNAQSLSSEPIPLRGRISSDFSPSRYSKQHATVELKTPHRVEIEREDALDILSCLVERGVSDWNTSVHSHSEAESDETLGAKELLSETEKEEKSEEAGTSGGYTLAESEITTVTEEIRAISKDRGKDSNSHSRRVAVLDELLRSHAYAVEMKRASASASTWLKSIGRGDFIVPEGKNMNIEASDARASSHAEEKSLGVGKDKDEVDQEAQGTGEKHGELQTSSESKMDLATLKAMLHHAQFELAETRKTNITLNEELSTCRAEIGRLKSFPRNEHLDRSILDESHDTDGSTVTDLSDAISKEGPMSPIQRSRSDIEEENRLFDVSTLNNTQANASEDFDNPPSDSKRHAESKDVAALLKALEKANATIRLLHTDLRNTRGDHEDNDSVEAPVVNMKDFEEMVGEDLQQSSSSPLSERRTVNVQMLDAENFTTDWMDLRPPLPPPPDHGLQSPIVDAVLEQWTDDRYLHQSLLSWIEEVMKGDNLEQLPPLTISSLDHQVRDGFLMHILPLLLRRADIHVMVKTRALRQTTYDMSVTVTQKAVVSHQKETPVPQPSLLDRQDSSRENNDQWMDQFEPRPSATESVAHSSVTDAAANIGRIDTDLRQPALTSPLVSPLEEGYSSFATQLRMRSSSADYSQDGSVRSGGTNGHGNTGRIMGVLGGAISGLLSRNKYALSPVPGAGMTPSNASHHAQTSDPRESNTMRNSLKAELDLTSSPVPTSSSSHYRRSSRFTPGPSSDEHQTDLQRQRRMREQEEYDQQPYHRVVSAPPGRIGVTFVEFRGHAMVSDVAADSPLSGWVFPSDILIAVDEVAVSGMRVRDIVKIMSDRKDRSRALRMVSSHDMNEFTSAVDTSELKTSEND